MIRLFVALKIPDVIRQKIITYRKEAYEGSENFKWEPEEKLHVTLKFIGDVKEEIVPEISEELLSLEKFGSLQCSLNKFGFFFKNNVPKILWIGIKSDPEVFSIVKSLNSSLEKFSIPKDNRKFKSHITILRLKGHPGEKFIESFRNFSFPESRFIADEIILYKSQLLPAGSKYTEIKKYKLK